MTTEINIDTMPGSSEPYPYGYAPCNEWGEVSGYYRGSLTLSGAAEALGSYPYGGLIARWTADGWRYNFGAGEAGSEEQAVALMDEPQ